jgi:hypothetical protein
MVEKLQLKNIIRKQKINERKKNALRKRIVENGYDYSRGLIIVSKDNKIIDGNHRYQACLEIFGGRAYMKVKKRNISYLTHIVLFILYNLFVVFSFILFIIYLWI